MCAVTRLEGLPSSVEARAFYVEHVNIGNEVHNLVVQYVLSDKQLSHLSILAMRSY